MMMVKTLFSGSKFAVFHTHPLYSLPLREINIGEGKWIFIRGALPLLDTPKA
jgi:hypothetical protein